MHTYIYTSFAQMARLNPNIHIYIYMYICVYKYVYLFCPGSQIGVNVSKDFAADAFTQPAGPLLEKGFDQEFDKAHLMQWQTTDIEIHTRETLTCLHLWELVWRNLYCVVGAMTGDRHRGSREGDPRVLQFIIRVELVY